MKLEHIEQSIVVVADRHNPSILHPSFLEKEKIIPEGLKLAESPLTTPDIAIASFDNGLRITVDNTRLQITNHKVEENGFDLSNVASAYLRVLPHVEYKSVGCNLFIFIEKDNAEDFLIKKFIKQGDWNGGKISPQSIGLRFVYSINDSVINLSYDAGKITKSNEPDRAGILIRGNHHTDVSNLEDAINLIGKFNLNIDTITTYIEATFRED